jgi:hypothetical protein
MENKQTAVEWFAERIQSDKIFNFQNVLKQAKQMEEEQIRDAWTDGCIGELYELNAYFSSGKYYNATYGKE